MNIKITFVILYDRDSVNTINLLNFINDNLDIFNNKTIYIDFIKIKPDDIKTEEFINFRNKYKIDSIPCLLLYEKNKDINVISEAQNIKNFLENIVTSSSSTKENNNSNDDMIDDDKLVENFMKMEINNKSSDEESLLGGDNDLTKKIKNYSGNKMKETINDQPLPIEKKTIPYDEKLLNKANNKNNESKKSEQVRLKEMLQNNNNEDDKLISSKFLNNLED